MQRSCDGLGLGFPSEEEKRLFSTEEKANKVSADVSATRCLDDE